MTDTKFDGYMSMNKFTGHVEIEGQEIGEYIKNNCPGILNNFVEISIWARGPRSDMPAMTGVRRTIIDATGTYTP